MRLLLFVFILVQLIVAQVATTASCNSCSLGAFSCDGSVFASQTIYQCDYGGWINLGGPVQCNIEGAIGRVTQTLSIAQFTYPSKVASRFSATLTLEPDPTETAASDTPTPKMASVYIADRFSSFRCQNASVCYPDDDMFAAVWTPFDPNILGYQDHEPPCCKKVNLVNPLNGIAIKVTILDRCCSCVGKCKTYGPDPSCGGFIPNGATIDLSPKAFQTLYGQTTGVFAIEYDGSPWLGTDVIPDDNASCK